MERFVRFAGALPEPGRILTLLALDCPSPVCPATGLVDIEMLSGALGSDGRAARLPDRTAPAASSTSPTIHPA